MRLLIPTTVVVTLLACQPAEETYTIPDDAEFNPLCEGEDLDNFDPGMERVSDSGVFIYSLLQVNPDPLFDGDNLWVVRVTDANHAPIDDGAVIQLVPFMEIHGHGTAPPEFFGARTTGYSDFEIGPFDLVMPGPWEFTVGVATGDPDDQATFRFCVSG